MRKISTILIMGLTFYLGSCKDLVINVQKKAKSDTKAAEVVPVKKTNLKLSEQFLQQIDELKDIGIQELFQQINGQDFRDRIRDGIRKYRASLITKVKAPGSVSFVDFSTDQLCNNDRIDVDSLDINKYLGPILKGAILGRLTEKSASNLNKTLADNLDKITKLILAEIGIKVDGDLNITNDNGELITKGNLSIGLVPLKTDPEDIRAKDEKEAINLNFTRTLRENDTADFTAVISVTELEENKLNEYSAHLESARSFEENGFTNYLTSFSLQNSKQAKDIFKRTMNFKQNNAQATSFDVIDTININDSEKTKTSTIDLDNICKVSDDKSQKEIDNDKKETDNDKEVENSDDDGSDAGNENPPVINDNNNQSSIIFNPNDSDDDNNNPAQNGSDGSSNSQNPAQN